MAKNMFATLGILAVLLLSFGLVSAYTSTQDGIKVTITTELPNPVTPGSTHDIKINVTNNNGTLITLSWIDTSATSGITASVPANSTLANGITSEYKVTYTIPSSFTGTVDHKVNLKAYDGTTEIANFNPYSTANYSNTTTPTPTTSETFCELEEYTEKGQLEISDFDVNNNGEGSDDEWEYLDQIEITVEVENTGSEDVDDVEVTILILDNKIENNGKDVTKKFDFDKEKLTSIGRLRDDDTEEVVFTIDELPSDLDSGTYYMYLMTYEDNNEEEQCRSEIEGDLYFEFEIESVDYEDSIVARGTELVEQLNTYCGQENLEITVPIYNIGDDEEEKILVNLYSAALGIDSYEIIEDLDNGDKEVVTFFITVPEGLTNERYNLDILTSFDWDDDRDEEDETSYDEQTSESIRLNILGCAAPEPSVTASLESETAVGTDIVVKATITNNGELNDFTITATGFEEWAELISVTPSIIEIASGNSQEVTIILSPTEAGVQTFEITTTVDGETYGQAVSVNIAERQYPLGMSKVSFYFAIAVAALTILIFLVLITRLARKTAATNF